MSVLDYSVYWQVSFQGMEMSTSSEPNPLILNAQTAIFVSGTNNIQMSSADYLAFANFIMENYNLPCTVFETVPMH